VNLLGLNDFFILLIKFIFFESQFHVCFLISFTQLTFFYFIKFLKVNSPTIFIFFILFV
jgi:hypothetical protein